MVLSETYSMCALNLAERYSIKPIDLCNVSALVVLHQLLKSTHFVLL